MTDIFSKLFVYMTFTLSSFIFFIYVRLLTILLAQLVCSGLLIISFSLVSIFCPSVFIKHYDVGKRNLKMVTFIGYCQASNVNFTCLEIFATPMITPNQAGEMKHQSYCFIDNF